MKTLRLFTVTGAVLVSLLAAGVSPATAAARPVTVSMAESACNPDTHVTWLRVRYTNSGERGRFMATFYKHTGPGGRHHTTSMYPWIGPGETRIIRFRLPADHTDTDLAVYYGHRHLEHMALHTQPTPLPDC